MYKKGDTVCLIRTLSKELPMFTELEVVNTSENDGMFYMKQAGQEAEFKIHGLDVMPVAAAKKFRQSLADTLYILVCRFGDTWFSGTELLKMGLQPAYLEQLVNERIIRTAGKVVDREIPNCNLTKKAQRLAEEAKREEMYPFIYVRKADDGSIHWYLAVLNNEHPGDVQERDGVYSASIVNATRIEAIRFAESILGVAVGGEKIKE